MNPPPSSGQSPKDRLHCRNYPLPIEIDGVKYPYMLANGVYTMTFNFTGNPVVVIPAGLAQNGLPIGVQIVGRRWQDFHILAIAEKLSEVIGDFQHPPVLDELRETGGIYRRTMSYWF